MKLTFDLETLLPSEQVRGHVFRVVEALKTIELKGGDSWLLEIGIPKFPACVKAQLMLWNNGVRIVTDLWFRDGGMSWFEDTDIVGADALKRAVREVFRLDQ